MKTRIKVHLKGALKNGLLTVMGAIVFLNVSQGNKLLAEEIDLSENTNINDEMVVYIPDLKRIQKAFSKSGEEDNTVVFIYDKYATFKIRTRVAMNTYIYLPEGEAIRFDKFGDEKNFRFTVLRDDNDLKTNIGFIEVINAGADTNLAIIGESGNFYNFYVRVDDFKSPHLPHHKVFVKDPKFRQKLIALSSPHNKSGNKNETLAKQFNEKKIQRPDAKTNEEIGDYLREIDNTPLSKLHRNQNLDFRYTIFLKKNLIAPMMVFDDKYWTYFRMSNKENMDQLKDYPVLFEVVDGIEQMVNIKTIGGYIIAENLSDTWALRVGERYICISKDINDSAVLTRVKK